MRIVQQTILMKYHTLFFQKLGKISQRLSSAAVVRVNTSCVYAPFFEVIYIVEYYWL